MKYCKLFSPIKVGPMLLKNRIVLPSMGTNLANPDGTISPALRDYLTERAKGGAGLIIVEMTAADYPYGAGECAQPQLTEINVVPSFRELADNIHAYGAKVLVQLCHSGVRTAPYLCHGRETIGTVDIPDASNPVHGLTKDEIKALVQKHATAALFAQMAGIDGIEFHAGHGTLLGQFLSPYFNKRTDEYGPQSLENRSRIVVELIKAVKATCGSRFAVSVRLGVQDAVPGGTSLEEGAKLARIIHSAGADLINVTKGMKYGLSINVETQDFEEGYRRFMNEAVRSECPDAKLAMVGRLRSPEVMEKLLEDGVTDLVCIGRQLICDPYWPEKVRTGHMDEIRTCLNCNEGCYSNAVGKQSGLRCALNPYVAQEGKYDERNLPQVRSPKNIVVAGGGIAGMEAAITAAKRGHKVTILEKNSCLGGQMNIACVPPYKTFLKDAVGYFERTIAKDPAIEVRLNTEADLETIKALAPDKVFVAIGSAPFVPPISGVENAVLAWDVLAGKVELPADSDVVVIGGGTVGVETAIYLAERNNRLSILEMLPKIAADQEETHKKRDQVYMKEKDFRLEVKAAVKEITADSVIYVNGDGTECTIPSAMTVLATGQRPLGAAFEEALIDAGIPAVSIGDAESTGNIRKNVRCGFFAGYYA